MEATIPTPEKRTRNRSVTPDQVVRALLKHHGFVSFAAQELRCSRHLIYDYRDRYPEVAQAFIEAKENTLDVAENALIRKIGEQDLGAICFFLKTQGKKRGYVERQELSGPEGGAIPVDVTSSLDRIYGDEPSD